ncbi:DUF6482 family protein [Pleionea sediminis]|uniref:DUF6482 family protein n=1 Tax=Pleionea sediminis TaxID=2569479 RepID=UPI0024831310|nr:DUF6482 family protein [Pleionea sediminis]
MNKTLQQLKMLQPLDKIIVHSIGMSLYQVSIIKDNRTYWLANSNGNLFKANNVLTVQKLFRSLNFLLMVLRHESAYDEMIGHDDTSPKNNRLEVPLKDNFLN